MIDPRSSSAQARLAYDAGRRSVLVSYLLWFFLGWLGAHRFYNRRALSGFVQLALNGLAALLSFVFIGFIVAIPLALWWLVDALLIPGWVERANNRLAASLEAR